MDATVEFHRRADRANAFAVRNAEPSEIDRLATLWHDAWHASHASIVAPELTRLRTRESFRQRLRDALPRIRVVGPAGDPSGFCIVRGTELHQLFVSAGWQGSGVADALIADAEAQLAASGVRAAWLSCAIGNERAARFYDKHGWRRAGTMVSQLETSAGPFLMETWRYEKSLTAPDESTAPGV